MADRTRSPHKTELIAEIARARLELSESLHGLKQDADIGAHFKNSFVHNKTAWISGAGFAGWALSKLSSRKKTVKVVVDKKSDRKVKYVAETGLALGVLKFLLSLSKPAIMAFATKKFTEMSSRSER